MTKKMPFYLTGPRDGPPTPDDILALYTALTGKAVTPEDIKAARKPLEQARRTKKGKG
jgi:hypothetical protein